MCQTATVPTDEEISARSSMPLRYAHIVLQPNQLKELKIFYRIILASLLQREVFQTCDRILGRTTFYTIKHIFIFERR